MLKQLFMRLSMICLLCLWLDHAIFAQHVFTNVELRQARCASTTESSNDAFANQASDRCTTAPWFVTHGSPDIHEVNGKRHIFIGSGVIKDAPANRPDVLGAVSEGVGYRETFAKNRRFKINVTFWGQVNKFSIFLANGLPTGIENEFIRNRKLPDIADKQEVFISNSVTTAQQTVEILFIPERDFESLWFFSESETVQESVSGGSTLSPAEFQVNALVCDIPIRRIINSTEMLTQFSANSSSNIHTSLPPKLTGAMEVNITKYNC